jgi:hypothetical protein
MYDGQGVAYLFFFSRFSLLLFLLPLGLLPQSQQPPVALQSLNGRIALAQVRLQLYFLAPNLEKLAFKGSVGHA